ncbi:MAG: hypothetical protein WC459_04055 [Patescibacteria group bacterium]
MSILKLILIDTVLDVLYFPVWWYSKGMVFSLKWAFREIADTQNFLGVHIWIKNIFTPMYGQYDIPGRIISFFMRFFQIILRSVAFLGFASFYLLMFFVYLILPIAVFYGIITHLPAIF